MAGWTRIFGSSGQHSYQSLADYLNTQGFRTRRGHPFTKGSVEHVLENRFYTGEVVYHPGKADEEVREGNRQLPPQVKGIVAPCQGSQIRAV